MKYISGMKYIRRRPNPIRMCRYTHAKQRVLREVCKPNHYGVPDILFRYEEFYKHYIEPKDDR